MDIEYTSTADFQAQVLDSSLPVLVDFTAAWCGPCKMLAPIVQQLAQDWSGKIQVYKLDVDQEAEISMRYQVMSIPTLILFVAGQPVQRVSGYQPKNRLVVKFIPYL